MGNVALAKKIYFTPLKINIALVQSPNYWIEIETACFHIYFKTVEFIHAQTYGLFQKNVWFTQ